MASVTFKNISKRFDSTEVLHDVSLEVADQEFMVLVGPSGCGKSTLLRILAGLEESSSGEIFIGGRPVDHLPPSKREIAMVFQDYALYPHMTVEENMSFGLRLRKLPKAEISTRVRHAADILQIGHLLGRRPRELSGGQRQRVAIGRAIVRQPQVFLFDEPLSNLDAKLREEMRVEIAKLHQRLKTTIIYVTHDQVEAMTLASRIAVVNAGQIQQVGSPQEVFHRPVNRFVAGFIGSPTMNFIEGRVETDGGKQHFTSAALNCVVPCGDGPAVLGIRPEAIGVDNPADNNQAVTGQVEVVELLGHRKNLYITVSGQRLLAVVEASFKTAPGETVSIRLDPAAIHLFDKATGQRLG